MDDTDSAQTLTKGPIVIVRGKVYPDGTVSDPTCEFVPKFHANIEYTSEFTYETSEGA